MAVLLKIYAHCIDGQADAASKRITDALYIALDQWLKTDTDRSIDALALEALAALRGDLDGIDTVQRPAVQRRRPSP